MAGSGRTVYEQWCQAQLTRNPQAWAWAVHYLERLHVGEWTADELAWFGQSPWPSLTLVDALAFGLCDRHLNAGHLALFDISGLQPPGRDRDVADNNDKLAALSGPFNAEFWGGTYENDGYLRWSAELQAGVASHDGRRLMPVSSRQVPLEVGTTSFVRTLCHLYQERGLARWPYGVGELRVIVWVGPPPRLDTPYLPWRESAASVAATGTPATSRWPRTGA